jgi:hypothetical protein
MKLSFKILLWVLAGSSHCSASTQSPKPKATLLENTIPSSGPKIDDLSSFGGSSLTSGFIGFDDETKTGDGFADSGYKLKDETKGCY